MIQQIHQFTGHFRCDHGFAARRAQYRVLHFIRLHILEQIAARAGAQGRRQIVLRIAHRQQQDRQHVTFRAQLFEQGNTVNVGHVEINHRDIRLVFIQQRTCAIRIATHTHHTHFAVPFQELR